MLLYIPFEQGISKLFSYFFFTFFFFLFSSLIYMTTPPISLTTPTHVQLPFENPLRCRQKWNPRERRAEQASKFHQTPILYDHPSSLEKCIPASSGIKSSILWAHWISMKSEGHHHFVELLTQRHPCRLSLEPHHVHLLKYTSHQFFQIRAFSNS